MFVSIELNLEISGNKQKCENQLEFSCLLRAWND